MSLPLPLQASSSSCPLQFPSCWLAGPCTLCRTLSFHVFCSCTTTSLPCPSSTCYWPHSSNTHSTSFTGAAHADQQSSDCCTLNAPFVFLPQTAHSETLLWACPGGCCCPVCTGRICSFCAICLCHAPHRGQHHEASLGEIMGLLIPQNSVATCDHVVYLS